MAQQMGHVLGQQQGMHISTFLPSLLFADVGRQEIPECQITNKNHNPPGWEAALSLLRPPRNLYLQNEKSNPP